MLLLDSQALLWLLDDNPRLGPQARQAITSAQGVHVSASRAGLRLLTADHVLLDLGRDFILDASR